MKEVIIITSVFLFGARTTWITGHYMLSHYTYNTDIGINVDNYTIYELQEDVILKIDSSQRFSVSMDIDTLRKYTSRQHFSFNRTRLLSLIVTNEQLKGFPCKKEVKTMEARDMYGMGLSMIQFQNIHYYASIPWLDSILNTHEKLEFAGFKKSDYSPYHFLISSYSISEGDPKRMENETIIERKMQDTSLIRNFLDLPRKEWKPYQQ